MADRTAAHRPRVAVIGGGIAGVSLAWLLDGACDVVLLEAQPRLGGHAQSVQVEHRGRAYHVDLGAQFFSPSLGPSFMHLLEELGIYSPAAPGPGGTFTCEMSLTIGDHGASRPRFVSPVPWRRMWPMLTPWNAPALRAFFAFARAARRFERDGDWNIALDDWLRGIPGLNAEQREHLILPWLSALSGCSIDAARSFSARAGVAPASRTLADGLIAGHRASHAAIGLGGVVELLAARCTTLTVHRSAAVSAVERTPSGSCVVAEGGRREQADHVVFAAPPHALLPLFAADSDARRWLQRFTWFSSRLVVHDQPTFMPQDRRMWSAYNATITDGYCEGSIWYGAMRDRLPDGSTVDLFKTWASARAHEPGGVLCSAEYKHPLLTPDFVRAQAELAPRQGRDRLWFVGSWTRDIDLQANALLSAIEVAQRLAPGAPNLGRLGRRMLAASSAPHA